MSPAPVFQVIAGNAPLRVVVVGTGAMGMSWCRAVQRHPDLELAGLADAEPRRAQGAAIRLRCPDLPVAGSLAGLAGTAADICVNVTVPQAHFDVTLAALRHGLAVLSEKPFAASLGEAARLVRAARAAGRLLMISQSRSYEPGLTRLRELTARIGRIGPVTTELSLAYRPGGFRLVMDQPLLLDMAVHAFDAVRLITGARPVSVYCDAFSPPWSWFRGPAAATVVAEMTGGIRYAYAGSWCSEGLATSWNGRWRVSGEHGTACWDGHDRLRLETGPADQDPPDLDPPDLDPPDRDHADLDPPDRDHADRDHAQADDPVAQVARPLGDFVRALRTGTIPWGECQDNLLTLAMAEAAIGSAACRTPIGIDALLALAEREAAACG